MLPANLQMRQHIILSALTAEVKPYVLGRVQRRSRNAVWLGSLCKTLVIAEGARSNKGLKMSGKKSFGGSGVSSRLISRRSLLAGSAGLTVAAAIGGGRRASAQESDSGQSSGGAQTHEVQMVNKDPEGRPMQFVPAYLKIAPGDSVKFVATDKGHNSEPILGMIPEGAETWKGKINEEITVTFDVEGIYGYKCLPHFALGMVGIIQVGDSTENLDSAETAKLPGKAKSRMAELIAQVGNGATAPAN
ncbi:MULTISPECIES: pseudoazurin [Hyphomicrobiales]|uniref:Pseudoazurin n=2 Tax=Hyphomicrobiales TaxID=356 RepID=A0A7W9Z1T6_9HYPH|nr:pseudoazurin [Pseudorhizobium flavum]MBB6182498.1 pseudoazurin [Pseudorhizobium flavum]MBB6357714.1 pseudoazurin [Aminobacter aganoensis]